jgi:hypothetical protein
LKEPKVVAQLGRDRRREIAESWLLPLLEIEAGCRTRNASHFQCRKIAASADDEAAGVRIGRVEIHRGRAVVM